MIIESRLTGSGDDERYVSGYFLTKEQLLDLIRDHLVDSQANLVPSSQIYLEDWLKRH